VGGAPELSAESGGLEEEGDDGGRESAGRKRARLGSPPDEQQQDARAEEGSPDDPAFQMEVERGLEDAVRAPAQQPGGGVARDLYCEEDAGDAADRDPA
jgi:hypothetical protein